MKLGKNIVQEVCFYILRLQKNWYSVVAKSYEPRLPGIKKKVAKFADASKIFNVPKNKVDCEELQRDWINRQPNGKYSSLSIGLR